MVEDSVISDIDDMLEIGYRQSHHPIKDNIENKQINETEKLPETGNRNNPVIRLYRRRYLHNVYPC